jgi:hypothetical protein
MESVLGCWMERCKDVQKQQEEQKAKSSACVLL